MRLQGDGFTDIRHLNAISTPAGQDVAPTETADGLTLFFELRVGDASVDPADARAIGASGCDEASGHHPCAEVQLEGALHPRRV